VQIPKNLRETIERVHGERGREWLDKFPALISECRSRWSLDIDRPFANLSHNLVLLATMPDGQKVVLKLGVPGSESTTEANTLDLFAGVGAVRLLAHDEPRGILLLERVVPGTPVYKLHSEEEATRTAATLMRQLWRSPPANHTFPSLVIWFQAFARLRNKFGGGSGPFPAKVIDKAERTFASLNASSDRSLILHGDLHHANILFSEDRGWLAIDPKGVCGDPGYEVGSFMLNRLPANASESATIEVFAQRLSIFSAELGVDRQRLAQWSLCHCVLSALWDLEDSSDWRPTIGVALMLEKLAK
jgi:streptomycin 6-kinase